MRHAHWSSQRNRIGNQSGPGPSVPEEASGRRVHRGGRIRRRRILRPPRRRVHRSRSQSRLPRGRPELRRGGGSAFSIRGSPATGHHLGVRGRSFPPPPAGSGLLHEHHHLAFARRDPASAHQRPRDGCEFQPRRGCMGTKPWCMARPCCPKPFPC